MADRARPATALQLLISSTSFLLHPLTKLFSSFFYFCSFSVLKRKPFFLKTRLNITNTIRLFLTSLQSPLLRKVSISALKQTPSFQFLVMVNFARENSQTLKYFRTTNYHSSLRCKFNSSENEPFCKYSTLLQHTCTYNLQLVNQCQQQRTDVNRWVLLMFHFFIPRVTRVNW